MGLGGQRATSRTASIGRSGPIVCYPLQALSTRRMILAGRVLLVSIGIRIVRNGYQAYRRLSNLPIL
jgi:hypothetical protein